MPEGTHANGPTFELPAVPKAPGIERLRNPLYLKPIIEDFFPEGVLETVAQYVLLQDLAAIAPNEIGGPYGALIDRVLSKALDANKMDALLTTLRRMAPPDPRLHLILSGLIDIKTSPADLHAILGNVGEPFINVAAVKERFPAAVDQICAIWIEGEVAGTGFLIGPDLVMTCYHVVKVLVEAETAYDENGNPRLVCLFDYQAAIGDHRNLADLPSTIKKVLPAKGEGWLIDFSKPHPDDGILARHQDPNPTDHLDFSVIRTAEPVGLSSVLDGGGRLRGWIELPTGNPNLQQGSRLFVIQHPAQEQLQFDIGAYMASIGLNTRLLYGANATGGSSGAPCFDSGIAAVGLHSGACNVSGDPGREVKANHGIRLDHIAGRQKVAAVLNGIEEKWDAASKTPIWSLSTDPAHPQPVLGRKPCFDYLETLLKSTSEKRVLVVAESEAGAQQGGHGKSFTMHIVRALIRDRGHIMIPFGVVEEPAEPPGKFPDIHTPITKQLVPKDVELWIQAIGRALGWIGTDFADMPPRPTETRQSARWVSTVLPQWFAGKLEEKARAARLVEKTPEGRDVIIRLVWIVLDDVHRGKLSDEAGDLLAGLVGVGLDESLVPPGLRALRFLILGHTPDVLRDAARLIDREAIEVGDITVDDLDSCVERAYRARGALKSFNPESVKRITGGIIDAAKVAFPSDPKSYLRLIGGVMSSVVQRVMRG